MPKLHTKVDWKHGPGSLITYERNPDDWYLRILQPGTKTYRTERIYHCVEEDEAQTKALPVYTKLVQPRIIPELTGGASVTMGEARFAHSTVSNSRPLNIRVETTHNKKYKSRPIFDTVTEYLEQCYQRYKTKDITWDTYRDREDILLNRFVGYCRYIGIEHTREIETTTFEKYNYYRSTVSKSKLTRNLELNVIKIYIDHYLVKRRLIDPEITLVKGFMPYQVIKDRID